MLIPDSPHFVFKWLLLKKFFSSNRLGERLVALKLNDITRFVTPSCPSYTAEIGITLFLDYRYTRNVRIIYKMYDEISFPNISHILVDVTVSFIALRRP